MGVGNADRLQFDSNALRVSAHGGHPPAERFPDGAVPLQRALAVALQTSQTSTQRGQRDSGGEHGLHHPSEEEEESRTSWPSAKATRRHN